MTSRNFPSVLRHCWLGDRKGKPVRSWVLGFVGVVDLTVALHDLLLQLSPPLPLSLASIKLANPGSPGKMAVKMERDEKLELEGCIDDKHQFKTAKRLVTPLFLNDFPW